MQTLSRDLAARFEHLVRARVAARGDGNVRLEQEIQQHWAMLEGEIGRRVSPLEVFIDLRRAAA